MALLSSDKKVAHILVQLGTYFKKNESDTFYVIDYTHEEISRLIGIARVTTTKVLKLFEKQGWIFLEYGKIKVIDETALKQYLRS
jgi:CRP/FNR family transcriptional regulator, cyclic AMP receptor protein